MSARWPDRPSRASAARCSPAASRSSPRCSKRSGSNGWTSPMARCATACCTTCVGRFTDEDSRERTVRAMQRAITSMLEQARARREDGARHSCARCGGLAARGSARRADCSNGRRGCTRSDSTSRIAATTAMARICSRTPTCRAFRARNSGCSRASSAGTGASSRSRAHELMPPWDRRALLSDRAAAPGRDAAPRPWHHAAAAAASSLRGGRRSRCVFRRRWLREHPLTVADLTSEVDLLPGSGFPPEDLQPAGLKVPVTLPARCRRRSVSSNSCLGDHDRLVARRAACT